ncbi:S-adenosylmethionine decarboxylase [Piedraia hortae CBS 480.64]|uniref:adenosylmethionine decarboxylase n=1 Tax=Piedraia hortae CBS 480.64 TaxID=1314780 RepID=A0A6A7CDZ3_9PEZI|nr:S-adenosylmethionine decarboxylase [Piedraia hortae CBS 480.64]
MIGGFETPPHYVNSPASSTEAQITANTDLNATDLDESNAFEGPEKLLEVWMTPSDCALPASASPRGLMAVSQESWKEMLDLVHCKILSVVQAHNMDAYLLSESSMFVYPHKLVLKTCGTTTLLLGLPRMLEIAAKEAGFPHTSELAGDMMAAANPYRVFYSRKNFLYPNQQKGPHRSWHDEVSYMDGMFVGGSAYMIGKMNGEHWYLYIAGPPVQLTPPTTPKEGQMGTQTQCLELPGESSDQTLEVLMTHLDEKNARQFTVEEARLLKDNPGQTNGKHVMEGHALGAAVTVNSGLANIYSSSQYPKACVDSYLFEPCGYSANGVVPGEDDKSCTHYWTVHVTPEPHCSYASFETNVPIQAARDASNLVENIVGIFKPARFSMTLFEARGDEEHGILHRDQQMDRIKGYNRVDKIVHDLDGYVLVFRYFEKNGWFANGHGGVRLGGV